jgi:hypothetical protein
MDQNNTVSMEIDGTTYVMPMFYAAAGETLTEKIKRLVQEDEKNTEIIQI